MAKREKNGKAKSPKGKLVTYYEATNGKSEWLDKTLGKKSTVGKVYTAIREHGKPITFAELISKLGHVKAKSESKSDESFVVMIRWLLNRTLKEKGCVKSHTSRLEPAK